MTDQRKRRAQGSGTMTELRSGVWRLRVFIGPDPVTGRPRQISRTVHATARDAARELAKFVAEAGEGKLGGTNATVALLLDAWLKDVRRQVSPATLAVYSHSVEHDLRAGVGKLKVSKLGVQHLDELYRTMGDRGSSPYVIKQAHSAIRAALAVGVRWGWVQTNVALLARPPALPHTEVSAPTPAEVRRLVTHIELEDPDLAHVVLLAALTGCRRAELCALRWSDWDGEYLSVTRRRIEAAGKVSERKGTKTGRGKRIVLDELGVATLARLRALQEARIAAVGARSPANGYLLSIDGMGGDPRRPLVVSKAVGDAARAIGLPDVHLHSLRHYAATELIAAGTDVRTVANRLGHSDPAITLRVYSHRIEARDREAAAVLGAALMSPTGTAEVTE